MSDRTADTARATGASGRALTSTGCATCAAGAIDDVSAERLGAVVPALAYRAERLMYALWWLGKPLRVTQGRRTQAEQDALWEQGRTKPGPIVTWTRESKHVRGRAVDFVWRTPDGVSYSGPWELLAMMAHEIGLVAGYYWRTPDRPHVELPDAVGDED